MSVFEFAGYTLDISQGRLRNDAGDVALRPKSLALLTYFVRNPGRVIAKDELVQAVWPDTFVSDDSLSQCLKDIRAALGTEGEGLIRTVPRRGYMLDEERLRQIRRDGDAPSAPDDQPQPERPSIAVLPFETAGSDQDWFSDGIAEDITTALARSGRLRVVSKNYSFAFKGRAMRGDEIARELRVRHLLEGSVRLAGRRVRVSTRLIEAETGDLVWAERFDRDMADIFAIQDEITVAVVGRLEKELLAEEKAAIRQARTASIEAYHYELRGRQLALALTKSNLLLARRMFARAAELDPSYARAHASMVICGCYLREWHGHAVAAEAILPIAEKALDLDPGLPEAYIAYGFALFGAEKYDEAERAYRQALSLDPNSYDANFFFASTMMRFRNNREGMVSLFTLAARLRPDDYISPMMIAAFLPWSDPQRPGWARTCIERAERAAKLNPLDPSPLHRGAVAYAYLGDRESAHVWLTRALAIEPDDFVAHVNASSIHAQFHEVDEALHHLEKAARQAPRKTIEMLLADTDYDAIRDDPRFSQILPARNG